RTMSTATTRTTALGLPRILHRRKSRSTNSGARVHELEPYHEQIECRWMLVNWALCVGSEGGTCLCLNGRDRYAARPAACRGLDSECFDFPPAALHCAAWQANS